MDAVGRKYLTCRGRKYEIATGCGFGEHAPTALRHVDAVKLPKKAFRDGQCPDGWATSEEQIARLGAGR